MRIDRGWLVLIVGLGASCSGGRGIGEARLHDANASWLLPSVTAGFNLVSAHATYVVGKGFGAERIDGAAAEVEEPRVAQHPGHWRRRPEIMRRCTGESRAVQRNTRLILHVHDRRQFLDCRQTPAAAVQRKAGAVTPGVCPRVRVPPRVLLPR